MLIRTEHDDADDTTRLLLGHDKSGIRTVADLLGCASNDTLWRLGPTFTWRRTPEGFDSEFVVVPVSAEDNVYRRDHG
jgi:hypothetical protein